MDKIVRWLKPSFRGLLFVDDFSQFIPRLQRISSTTHRNVIQVLCELQKKLPEAHTVYTKLKYLLEEDDRKIMVHINFQPFFSTIDSIVRTNILHTESNALVMWQLMQSHGYLGFQPLLCSNISVSRMDVCDNSNIQHMYVSF